ncbi:MAG: hypothetical protein K2M87_01675 [Muribaculaceae bacterium]|nr:hypothetical protein [Muribaculaceae bacterium]
MYGTAIGIIGLSIADFEAMTPEEFGWVTEHWRRGRDAEFTRFLSAVRLHAAIVISPYTSKPIAPADLFEIPDIDKAHGSAAPRKMTREEQRKRFEELKKARGYE